MAEDGPKWVVVIDDDEAVLESFQFMLELAGFPVAAYSSATAYLRTARGPSCCMILDQNMPGMTGLELAAMLRASGNHLPILLITAAPTPALVARAGACGVERILAKPPPEQDVIAFVSRCVGA